MLFNSWRLQARRALLRWLLGPSPMRPSLVECFSLYIIHILRYRTQSHCRRKKINISVNEPIYRADLILLLSNFVPKFVMDNTRIIEAATTRACVKDWEEYLMLIDTMWERETKALLNSQQVVFPPRSYTKDNPSPGQIRQLSASLNRQDTYSPRNNNCLIPMKTWLVSDSPQKGQCHVGNGQAWRQ